MKVGLYKETSHLLLYCYCTALKSATFPDATIRRSLGSSRKSVHERPQNSDGRQVK